MIYGTVAGFGSTPDEAVCKLTKVCDIKNV